MKANPNFEYLHERVNNQRVTLLQGGTRCFVGNTLVNTLTGYKPIESVSVGEYVYSYNKGRVESKKVVNKFLYKNEHSLHKLITLVLYNNEKITSTYEHKHLQSNGYVRAIDIGKRAMARGCKYTQEIYDKQLGAYRCYELQEGETGNYNEASDRRERILQDNAFNKREVFDNKGSQNSCGSIFAKLRKQSRGESHKQYKDRQPVGEFGVGNTQGEYSAHDETRAASVQQRFKKWYGKNYGGECFGGAKFIQTLCSYGKRLGEEIRNFYVPHERNIGEEKLEANLICDADIKEVILHEYNGTVYDIEVEDNHNFLITESNYVTHNSGKTYATIYFLIDYCLLYTGMEIDIVRDTFTALKATAWKDFQDVLMSCNLYDDRNHNKTDHSYTLNGNNINYYGADTPDKIHGRSRDILWINEAHQFPQSTIDQLFPRTRYRIICDYNPALGLEHWLDKYIAKYPPKITTYTDNPYLTIEQIEDIESRRDNKYWWSIYGSGERAAREGAIFTNWNIGEFDTSLPYCYGQDYGFSIDPTTLIKVAIDSSKNIVYCHELLYSTNSMGTEAIYSTNKELIEKPNDLIVADNAEGRLISDLKGKGLNIIACTKGQGSVQAGITALQDYTLVVTNTSVNLKSELSNYIWNDKKAGIPVDAFNHCFVGETLITTINGNIRIDEIVEGDLVLTSQGYKPVLKVFNNGVKQVNKYLMQFDTFSLYLTATESHKIKTDKEWKCISKLQKGENLYLFKSLMANNTSYTQMKNTFHAGVKECTLPFGSSTMAKFLKGFTFTIKTVASGTIKLITWNCLNAISILLSMVKKGTKIIPNGQRRFIQRVLNQLRSGINQKMELSGIQSNKKEIGKLKNGIAAFANNVAKNIKALSPIGVNSAITTAKLKHLEVEESMSEVVYDLMIEECHEYFANGVLVHNCIDPIRYAFNKLNNVIIVAPPRALGNRYRNED